MDINIFYKDITESDVVCLSNTPTTVPSLSQIDLQEDSLRSGLWSFCCPVHETNGSFQKGK